MRKSIIITVMAVLFLVSPLSLKAQDGDTDATEVSFCISNEDRFKLTIRVGKGGEVRDGSQHIVNGTVIYDIAVGQEKQFRVIPDKGYQISELSYARPALDTRRRNLLDEVKNGYVTVHTESTEMLLEVTFKKNKTPAVKPGDTDVPDRESSGKPDTGTVIWDVPGTDRVVISTKEIDTKTKKQVKKDEKTDKDETEVSKKVSKDGKKQDNDRLHWELFLFLLILLLGIILSVYYKRRKKRNL